MILIYSDSKIIDSEWIPSIRFPGPIEVCRDFDYYINSTVAIKIAFTTDRFALLHYHRHNNIEFKDKLVQLSKNSNFVFNVMNEFHYKEVDHWIQNYQHNIYYLYPGAVRDNKLSSLSISFPDWFRTTADVYRRLLPILNQLSPYDTKTKYFDALLGSPKPHRDFIYKAVQLSDLENKIEMVYGGHWNTNNCYVPALNFIYEKDIEIVDKHNPLIYHTMSKTKYHGTYCLLSQVIPIEVFNNTAYSIVAETDCDNALSFFTEKTAKPLIARRLFVAFSGYKFLYNLKELGFKTFSNVIDESYDLIENTSQRLTAAFKQVKYLCSVPQEKILYKIKDITEHNYNHIMNTDWTKYSCDQINRIIKVL